MPGRRPRPGANPAPRPAATTTRRLPVTSAQAGTVAAVLRHPRYQELLRRRSRTSLLFFTITGVIYAGFILTLAFDPVFFARPLPGMTMSIGVLTGTLVVCSAVVLIAAYVRISNTVFDPLLTAIIKDVS
ncbi:DUF485 domain-containing protein [Achromobacter denitrificans]|nr:DUF485 domain-containing protein [Achromobacter denitrificans]QKH53830.1 DUF485 domain-containing protein [Achromobacter denitrificans]